MNAIVIVDQNWAIGREGGLLFSLPGEMKRFRALTLDGTVILGRKTLDTFPGGRPLPRRRNLVVTRNPEFAREGAEVFPSTPAALEAPAGEDRDKLWVIGAGSIVTRDIPSGVVAVGNPCRVMRPVGERDRTYYFKDRKIPWQELEGLGFPT